MLHPAPGVSATAGTHVAVRFQRTVRRERLAVASTKSPRKGGRALALRAVRPRRLTTNIVDAIALSTSRGLILAARCRRQHAAVGRDAVAALADRLAVRPALTHGAVRCVNGTRRTGSAGAALTRQRGCVERAITRSRRASIGAARPEMSKGGFMPAAQPRRLSVACADLRSQAPVVAGRTHRHRVPVATGVPVVGSQPRRADQLPATRGASVGRLFGLAAAERQQHQQARNHVRRAHGHQIGQVSGRSCPPSVPQAP